MDKKFFLKALVMSIVGIELGSITSNVANYIAPAEAGKIKRFSTLVGCSMATHYATAFVERRVDAAVNDIFDEESEFEEEP